MVHHMLASTAKIGPERCWPGFSMPITDYLFAAAVAAAGVGGDSVDDDDSEGQEDRGADAGGRGGDWAGRGISMLQASLCVDPQNFMLDFCYRLKRMSLPCLLAFTPGRKR